MGKHASEDGQLLWASVAAALLHPAPAMTFGALAACAVAFGSMWTLLLLPPLAVLQLVLVRRSKWFALRMEKRLERDRHRRRCSLRSRNMLELDDAERAHVRQLQAIADGLTRENAPVELSPTGVAPDDLVDAYVLLAGAKAAYQRLLARFDVNRLLQESASAHRPSADQQPSGSLQRAIDRRLATARARLALANRTIELIQTVSHEQSSVEAALALMEETVILRRALATQSTANADHVLAALEEGRAAQQEVALDAHPRDQPHCSSISSQDDTRSTHDT